MQSRENLASLRRGFDRLVMLLAPTLGPAGRTVLHSQGRASPEVLVDSGTIVRRVTELPDRAENVGAMILRNLVWTVHEEYGDGAATAGILAKGMLDEATRMIAAGAHPVLVRKGIERGVAVAVDTLASQAIPIAGQAMLTRLASGVTGDPEMGAILGEMIDILGADAALLVEEYAAPHLDRQYLDGGRWRARPATRLLMPEGRSELVLENPIVLVVEDALKTSEQIVPALDLAMKTRDKPPLLVVAKAISDEALQALTINHVRGTLTIGAMVLTSARSIAGDELEDLTLLAGGELLSELRGRPVARVSAESFGRARRATLGHRHLTFAGGAGEPTLIRQRIDDLRLQSRRPGATRDIVEKLRMRTARLSGGVGVLRVGAHTERERKIRTEQAKRAMRVFERTLRDGVVSGGGVAYLDCVEAVLAESRACTDRDEAAGMSTVAAALEAPFLQIVRNRGLVHPPLALAKIRRLGKGYGYDATTGQFGPMEEMGVLDSLGVTCGALETAASAVGATITIGSVVFVAPRRRKVSIRP